MQTGRSREREQWSLNHGGICGRGKKYLNSRYFLKVKLKSFASGLAIAWERKKGIKDDSKAFS